MKRSHIMLCIVAVTLVCCQTVYQRNAFANSNRKIEKGLSEAHSAYRAQHIQNVTYDLDLDLMDSQPQISSAEQLTHYNGKLVLEFELDKAVDITLDFNGGEFKSVMTNGKTTPLQGYNDIFLPISSHLLQKGRNQIILVFRHAFTTNGSGLYKFTDKEDGRVYVYTDLEPFGANMVFPCFDQPDLKATFSLKVRAPADWQIITSVLETKVEANPHSKTWVFAASPKISTYVFSLHGGPYAEWTSHYRDIPLRLFARKSLARFVRPPIWFGYTQSGMKYFESYFDFPYPFKKYDQIIVPDFNSGAMENVAAVTFSENYIQRGKYTNEELEELANTLLHELAHMWFGNLVTMKWWNDLWLNESFATFMATKAIENMGTFRNPWQSFYAEKKWAYWDDQLVTTHPVEDKVTSTEEAFTNFDGITYGKGAASLKQLLFLIGEQNFQSGLRFYFKHFAYSNTRLDDFISTLATAAQMDLRVWTSEWLRTKGVNSIQANFTCSQNKIDSFELLQSAPKDNPTLRTHKTFVAFFQEKAGQLKITKTQDVQIVGARTSVNELIGADCPDLVYPNFDDQAYFKSKLDPRTLENLPKMLSKVPDILTRTMFWDNLWNMVRDAELPLTDYANMILENIELEHDDKLFSSLLTTLTANAPSVQFYIPNQKEFENQRHQLDLKIETTLWRILKSSSPGSDKQKNLFTSFISATETEDAYEKIKKIIEGSLVIKGLDFDQDLRWYALTQMAKFGRTDLASLVQKEAKRDSSDRGKKALFAIRASNPNPQNKSQLFRNILTYTNENTSTESLADLRATMDNLFPRRQKHLRLAFANDYFKSLPKLEKITDSYFVENYVTTFIPLNCDPSANTTTRTFLETNQSRLPYQVVKKMKVSLQEDERCYKIQNVMLRQALK